MNNQQLRGTRENGSPSTWSMVHLECQQLLGQKSIRSSDEYWLGVRVKLIQLARFQWSGNCGASFPSLLDCSCFGWLAEELMSCGFGWVCLTNCQTVPGLVVGPILSLLAVHYSSLAPPAWCLVGSDQSIFHDSLASQCFQCECVMNRWMSRNRSARFGYALVEPATCPAMEHSAKWEKIGSSTYVPFT